MSPPTDARENPEFAAEIKVFIEPAIVTQIRDWALARLAPDPNASGALGDAVYNRHPVVSDRSIGRAPSTTL